VEEEGVLERDPAISQVESAAIGIQGMAELVDGVVEDDLGRGKGLASGN
jgi:hypothetical protein